MHSQDHSYEMQQYDGEEHIARDRDTFIASFYFPTVRDLLILGLD